MAERNQKYKWEAATLEGFIQQLAVGYVARGYFFYVTGHVPSRLANAEHDRRMLTKFNVACSKWSRYRRRRRGLAGGESLASVQYIRFREFWVLLATHGKHCFFDEHRELAADGLTWVPQYNDVRERPIQFGGYSVGWRERVTVRISPRAYRELRAYFVEQASNRKSIESLEHDFSSFPFEPYAGVTRQLLSIYRHVNRVRRVAGLCAVPRECLRIRRRPVRPFELSPAVQCLAKPSEEIMRTTQQKGSEQGGNVVDLFKSDAPQKEAALRACGQRERLGVIACELAAMLDRLDIELKVDRETALSMLAEYTGLIEIAVMDLGRIRELDDKFGGQGRRVPRIAKLAEKLEKELAYLLGVFSVASSGEPLSPFSWKLIERDVQTVLGVSRAIEDEVSIPPFREAA